MRTDLPDPTIPEADWLAGIVEVPEFDLRSYKAAGGKEKSRYRLWLIEAAQKINASLYDGIIMVALRDMPDGKRNFFSMTDDAKDFWRQHLEQGIANQAILDAWRARPK